MRKPLYDEGEQCIEYRKKSKRGGDVTEEEHRFCVRMLKKYPEWYSKTEARVFNETVPFGSQAHMEEEPLD